MSAPSKRLIVVGAVAAGPKAAAKARRCDPSMQITMIDRGHYISYGGCGMPYLLGDEIRSSDELRETPAGVLRSPEFFKKSKGIDVLVEHEVTRIDRDKKTVEVKDLNSGAVTEMPYDKLVLACGSTPAPASFPGADLDGVYRLTCLDEAESILARLALHPPKHVVCIGGGLVSLETASGLMRRGLAVSFVARSDRLLFRLDYEMAHHVRKEVEHHHGAVYTGEDVLELIGDEQGRVAGVRTDKRTIEADMVLVAKGVRPNSELAVQAGLDIGTTGGIRVDGNLRTSDPDIYAAGDCVETHDLITGKPTYQPRGSTANKQGRVVGINVTGGNEQFPGVIGNVVLKVCDLNVGWVGLTETVARKEGHDVETVIVPAPDRAHFFPGANTIILKLVAERHTGRLLGLQAVGKGDVTKRIDVATAMITCGATVDTLSNLDLGYAPPFSPVLDPIITAANVMKNKLDGRVRGMSPMEVKRKRDRGDDFILLDVRDDDEYEAQHIPGTVLIPLGQLGERLAELPKNKEIVAFCRVSLRGYGATLKLEANGFADVKLMDGGIVAWPFETEAGKYQPSA